MAQAQPSPAAARCISQLNNLLSRTFFPWLIIDVAMLDLFKIFIIITMCLFCFTMRLTVVYVRAWKLRVMQIVFNKNLLSLDAGALQIARAVMTSNLRNLTLRLRAARALYVAPGPNADLLHR